MTDTIATEAAPTADRFDTKAAENALEILVLAYIKERQKPDPARSKLIRMTPFSFKPPAKLKTKRTIYREHIIKKPIEGALRLAIRELGEHAFANGVDLDGMLAILDNVAERHPDCEGRILSAVDHAWDGIGFVGGKIGWCS